MIWTSISRALGNSNPSSDTKLYQAVMLLYLNDHGLSPNPSSPRYSCSYALIPSCDAPNFRGSFFILFFFYFSFKSSIYFSFTYPKYMKIYCSNIFLQKSCSRPQPDLLLLTASREHRLLVYLKGGVPRRGEQSSVVIISYKGYSPPKCTCNDCIENTFK